MAEQVEMVVETGFRWVRHSVEGLRLFVDIVYDADETCTGDQETHVKEIDLREPVLHMIAGEEVPEIPEEIRIDEFDEDGGSG